MRQHDLSNRVFKDAKAIDESCRDSWNKITPEQFQSITATAWMTHEG